MPYNEFNAARKYIMNTTQTMNQRLAAAGVKTIRNDAGIFLTRNGITLVRPNVANAAAVCLAVFNVVI